ISQWVESGNNKAPQISERSAETTVRVKNGETILLGGLLKNEEIKSIKQIPFLSKIPILGEIFKSRSIEKKDTEIVIAITPTIVYDENGRPKVETQTSTKGLRDKLNELRAEREGYAPNSRTDADAKAELDKAKAKAAAAEVDKDKLAASLKEREDILSSRRSLSFSAFFALSSASRAFKKSTALMRAVIDSMDEGGRHEQ
uniref:type II secretion system protein GspD n=1 Tax=Phascolarctobacterium succinatutens TaxID=626940 RepID=UPI003C6E23D5